VGGGPADAGVAGLESGTLHFLAASSRVATIALLVVLVLAVGHLG